MLYDTNYFASSFDELITYYPRFYREVYEMVEILKAEGKLADEIETNIDTVLKNCFIDTADEPTIRKYEEILNIKLERTQTLDERRALVKSFFIGRGKISADVICTVIEAYTGDKVVCKFEPFDAAGNNKLFIDSFINKRGEILPNDVLFLISLILPAHIFFGVTFRLESEEPLYAGIRALGESIMESVLLENRFVGEIKRETLWYAGISSLAVSEEQNIEFTTPFVGVITGSMPVYTGLCLTGIEIEIGGKTE